jgi:hypothetical protein
MKPRSLRSNSTRGTEGDDKVEGEGHLGTGPGGWTESTNEGPHAGPEAPNDPVRSS